jgi:hypothetical protein
MSERQRPSLQDLGDRVGRCRALVDAVRRRPDASRHAREVALLEQRVEEALGALEAASRTLQRRRPADDDTWRTAEAAASLLGDACWWMEQRLGSDHHRVA